MRRTRTGSGSSVDTNHSPDHAIREIRSALIPPEGGARTPLTLLCLVRADETCRPLMTVRGVGPIVAITFTSAVDDPTRFAKSKTLGAHFGLTPKKYQSGEVDRTGRISKVGDAMVRTALFEAATVMLTRTARFSALKAWALRVASRQGLKKAGVALARKLAIVLHRMWIDGTTFRWSAAPRAVAM